MPSLSSDYLLAIACRHKAGGVIINEHCLNKAQTRLHIEALGRWFDFIGLDELGQRLERPGARPFCLLTFDDGKRSNATESAPELERCGVPAVFYLPTAFITHGKPLWFDQCRALQRALGHCPPDLELETLKHLPLTEIDDRIESAKNRYNVSLDLQSDDVLPMSWDQVRSLHRRGFVFGAHGVRHTILTREPEATAFDEIDQSLAQVSAELGEPCITFAFPNGNFNTRLVDRAWSSGAHAIMTTEPMWVGRGTPLWQLPRLQLFGKCSRSRIELKLGLAALPGVLRNPDGSGRTYFLRAKEKQPSEAPSRNIRTPLSR